MRERSLRDIERDAASLGRARSYAEGAELVCGEGFETGCCDRER